MMKNQVICNTHRCKGCNVCASHCPQGCLKPGSTTNAQGYVTIATVEGKVCIACGLCLLACPEPYALTIVKEVEGASCQSA